MPACDTHQVPACLDPADAKVCNLGAAVDVQQDILRLQVPVHNAGMQVRQPLCHVVRYLRMPPHAEPLQERLALLMCTIKQR